MHFLEDTVINNVVRDDIVVSNNATLTLTGISVGKIHLAENSTCILSGIHDGNIYVDKGCFLSVRGTLKGCIFNSGRTDIYGIVDATKIEGNDICIHKNSIINGKTYLHDETML